MDPVTAVTRVQALARGRHTRRRVVQNPRVAFAQIAAALERELLESEGATPPASREEDQGRTSAPLRPEFPRPGTLCRPEFSDKRTHGYRLAEARGVLSSIDLRL